MTSHEVSEVLASRKEPPLVDQVETLTNVVLDLLVEVEALRRLHLSESGERARYAKSYEETALLSHNFAGPSSGPMKVIEEYYPTAKDGDRAWRETLMLNRLGRSPDEIENFKARAEEAELYT